MSVNLDVQYVISEDDVEPPSSEEILTWVEAVLSTHRDEAELTVRIVDTSEICHLNRTYRQQNKPTNVLSFPFEKLDGIDLPLLGDVVVCAAVVAVEAVQQQKPLQHHWAHMVVHGVLHLLGYDHVKEQDAEIMEGLEIEVLNRLGIDNPYQEDRSEEAV